MSYIYNTIYKKAEETWPKDEMTKDHKAWMLHCIETCKSLIEDYRNEGLLNTVNSTSAILTALQDNYNKLIEESDEEQKFINARLNGEYIGYDHGLFIKMLCEDWKTFNRMPKSEWEEMWKNKTKEERKDIALRVEMTFGREAQKTYG